MNALKFSFVKECWFNDEALVLILNMILIFGLEISVTPNNFIFMPLHLVVNGEKRGQKGEQLCKLSKNALVPRVFHSHVYIRIHCTKLAVDVVLETSALDSKTCHREECAIKIIITPFVK